MKSYRYMPQWDMMRTEENANEEDGRVGELKVGQPGFMRYLLYLLYLQYMGYMGAEVKETTTKSAVGCEGKELPSGLSQQTRWCSDKADKHSRA